MRERAREVGWLCSFFEYAEGELRHSLIPIPEICRGFSENEPRAEAFLSALALGEGAENTLLYLDNEERGRLSDFLSSFGRGYSDEEIARLSEIREYFGKRRDEAKEAAKSASSLLPIVFCLVFTLILFLII